MMGGGNSDQQSFESWMSSVDRQESAAIEKGAYLDYKSKHYNKKSGTWGEWQTIRPIRPGRIFTGEKISMFDGHKQIWLKSDKGILVTPAANPYGYKSKKTPMFGIDIFGNIIYK